MPKSHELAHMYHGTGHKFLTHSAMLLYHADKISKVDDTSTPILIF